MEEQKLTQETTAAPADATPSPDAATQAAAPAAESMPNPAELLRQAELEVPSIYGPTKEGWAAYGMEAPRV